MPRKKKTSNITLHTAFSSQKAICQFNEKDKRYLLVGPCEALEDISTLWETKRGLTFEYKGMKQTIYFPGYYEYATVDYLRKLWDFLQDKGFEVADQLPV